MAWIDGLDIPLQYITEAQFFEFGRDEISEREKTTPERSRAERLWGHPGLAPVAKAARPAAPGSPLLAYRWEHTDRALADQLALEREGYPGTVEPGHAAVRYTDPATGGDVLPTIRVEMHRIARNAETGPPARPDPRSTPSSTAPAPSPSATRPGRSAAATCSWCPPGSRSRPSRRPAPTDSDSGALDLFRFSDSPVFEALKLNRASTERTEAVPSEAGDEPPGERNRTSSSSAAASAACRPRSP